MAYLRLKPGDPAAAVCVASQVPRPAVLLAWARVSDTRFCRPAHGPAWARWRGRVRASLPLCLRSGDKIGGLSRVTRTVRVAHSGRERWASAGAGRALAAPTRVGTHASRLARAVRRVEATYGGLQRSKRPYERREKWGRREERGGVGGTPPCYVSNMPRVLAAHRSLAPINRGPAHQDLSVPGRGVCGGPHASRLASRAVHGAARNRGSL